MWGYVWRCSVGGRGSNVGLPPSVIQKHPSYIDSPNAQHFLDWKDHGEAIENEAGRGFLEAVEDFHKIEEKTYWELVSPTVWACWYSLSHFLKLRQVMSDSSLPHGLQPPGSSVRGIFQARILEWVAISYSRRSSRPRDQTHVSCIGRQILYYYPNSLFFISMNLNWHVDVILVQVFSGLFTWPWMAKYFWMGTHSCAINIGFEASSATSWQRLSFHVAEMGVVVFHQGIGMKGVIIWKLPHSSLRHSIPACEVASVLSDSLQHYGLYPSRLLCPWGSSRQEYWSGLLRPPPGDLANSGIEPTSLMSPALAVYH